MNEPTGPLSLSPRPLAILGIAGVLILALGGRTGVAAISPIAQEVQLDLPLSGLWLALLGAIPPIAYALSGLFTPRLAARLSLEGVAVLVAAITALAHIVRGFTPNYLGLFFSTVVLMLGIGVLNVILPGLVKLYAPTRIGVVTSLYSTMMAIGTALPAAIGLTLAGSFGWRISLASWSLISILAVIPYLVLLPKAMRRTTRERLALGELPQVRRLSVIGRSATARAITLTFAVSGFTAYSIFAVLPQIVMEHSGRSAEEAAVALTVFSIMGLPMSLVIPILAVRRGWSFRLVVFAGIVGASGFLGLAFLTSVSPVIWAVLTGLNTLTFSMSLALIGKRTSTHQMATELSGYVNTVGYLVSSLGPVLVGALREIAGSWLPSLLVQAVFALVLLPAAVVLSRENTIEQELAEH